MKKLAFACLTAAGLAASTSTHALGLDLGGVSVDLGVGGSKSGGATVNADVNLGNTATVDADVSLGGTQSQSVAGASVDATVGGSSSGGGLNAGADVNIGGSGASVSASLGSGGTGGSGGNGGGGSGGGTGGGGSGGGTGGSGSGGGTGGSGSGSGNGGSGSGGGSSNSGGVATAGNNSNTSNLGNRRSFAPVLAPAPLIALAGLTVWTRDNVYVGIITDNGNRANGGIRVSVQINPKLGLRSGQVQFQFADTALRGDRVILNLTSAQLAQQLS